VLVTIEGGRVRAFGSDGLAVLDAPILDGDRHSTRQYELLVEDDAGEEQTVTVERRGCNCGGSW